MRNVITKIIFHNIMVTMARFEVDREFLTHCCGFGDTKSQIVTKLSCCWQTIVMRIFSNGIVTLNDGKI